jgi:hypothetical protein
VLSAILHDWNDEDAVRILRSVLELVAPEESHPHPAWLIDLIMLVMNGGRERTAGQWRELLATGGFRLCGVTQSPRSSLLEAEPT